MLKIQMQRTGRRNDPAFRIVVGEHTIGAKSGKFKEKLGSHHPKTKHTVLDGERIKYWLSVGAKATGRVHNLLISEGVIEGKKVNVLPKHTPIRKEQPAEEAASSTAGAAATGAATEAPETASETVAEEAASSEESSTEAPAEETAKETADTAPEAAEAPTADAEEAEAPEKEKAQG